MKLLFVVCAAISTFYAAYSATPQWYAKQWAEMSKQRSDNKPSSAQKIIDETFEQASKDGNYLEMFKALQEQWFFRKSIDWNELTSFPDSIRKLDHLFQGPLSKANFYIKMAEWLQYARANGASKDTTDYFYSRPINEWSDVQKSKAILKYVKMALTYADSIKYESPGDYDKMLFGKNPSEPSKNVYIWVRRAIPRYIGSNLKDESGNNFMDCIFDELLAATTDNPYLFTQTYMNDHRMRQWYLSDSVYLGKLDSLIARFPDHPAIVWPIKTKLELLGSNKTLSYNDIDSQLDELITRFPDSRDIYMVRNYKRQLHAMSGEIDTPAQIYPGKKTYIHIEYCNIDYLNFTVYALPDSTDISIKYDAAAILNRTKILKPVMRKSLKLQPELYITKKTNLEIAVKKPGKYLLVCTNKQDSIMAATNVNASRVGALYRKSPRGLEVYTADFETGKPFEKVNVNIESTAKDQKDNFTKHIDANGGFSVALSPGMVQNDQRIRMTAEVGNDVYSVPYSSTINGSSTPDNQRRTNIYTDRKRYASRDTVFFKAYIYEIGDSVSRVCKGIDNWFYLCGTKGERLMTSGKLISDEYGGYNGYFVLDGSHISGSYSIKDNFGAMSGSIIVGDFKLPTLSGKIEFERNDYSFGDTIKLNGNVVSYAGFPVEGVAVNYRVKRFGNPYLLSSSNRRFANKIIVESETSTNSDGDFTICFDAEKPEEAKNQKTAVYYSITATITDERGETQELSNDIYVGEYKYALRTELPDAIERNSEFKPIIKAQHDSWNKVSNVSGIKGHFRIKEHESEHIVLEGQFISGEPIPIDWNKLACKEYDLIFSSDDADESMETFDVYDLKTSEIPEGLNQFFTVQNRECAPGDPIEFIFGTTATRQFAAVELFEGDSLLWSSNMEFGKGIRKYTIPYHQNFPDNVYLNITSIYKGAKYDYNKYYERKKAPQGQLEMKIVSLRETSTPGAKDSIAVEVKDENGKGVETSVLISIYDKATDYRYRNSFGKLSSKSLFKYSNVRSSSACFYFNTLSFRPNVSVFGQDKNTIGYATGAIATMNSTSMVKNDAERSDFRRTAAFITDMQTDSNGYAMKSFTLPDALTTYNVLALAVAKDARSAVASAEIVTKKDLMAITNFPQYLRTGDRAELRIQARNLSDQKLDATLTLTAESSKGKDTKTFALHLPADSSNTVSWGLDVPEGVGEILFTADLDSKRYRDIEKRTIPVIEAKEHFTNGKSAMVRNGTIELDLSKLVRAGGENERLNIKVSSAKTAILSALPLAMEPDPKSLIDILNNWYINGAGCMISGSYRGIIDSWIDGEKKANIIDRNTPITGISASETPWRLKENVLDRGKALQTMHDRNESYKRSEKMIDLFSTYQNRDGGYPWFRGMPSSKFITMLLLDRYNALFDCGYFVGNKQFAYYSDAITYLDKEMMSIYDSREKYTRLPYDVIDYIYVRAPLLRYKFTDEKYSKMWTYFVNRAKQEWRKYPIAEIAKVAMAMKHIDSQGNIDEYLASLSEYAVPGKSFGTYFPNAVMPFRGMIESELRAHAIMLRLFDTSERYADIAEGIAQWLMSQRVNQQWPNSTATADVIWAITNHYDAIDKKSPAQNGGFRIDMDEKYLLATTSFRGSDIDPQSVRDGKLSKVKVLAVGNRPCFIEVSYSYDLPLVAAETQGNGFKVVRTLFREIKGGNEELINENTLLKPGDIVIARYHITSTENRSFVMVKALRSGALEPVDNVSGYSWKGYYREVKDSHTNYFFDKMPEGDNLIEERFHVWYTGRFNDGLVKVQSLMVPAYSANTPAGNINVSK